MKIIANRIDIEVEDSDSGAPTQRPVVLLIMGLGLQLTAWPPALLQGLVDAGYRVVRFDNRDSGLSQHFDPLGTPNLLWEGLKYQFGWKTTPPYTLQDMARDALGVLDALQVASAHVVGVSMGAMVAQRLALLAPGRVSTLSSIMSSSGARGLPAASPAVKRALLSRPADKSRPAAMAHTVKLLKAIGSVGFPTPDAELQAAVRLAMARNFHPQGIARQMVAIVADTTRADALCGITAPTLVVHGRADPLVPFACGEDSARRIPGAQLVGIDGMGHDLPPGVVERLLPRLISHFKTAPTGRQSHHEPS